MKCKVYKAQGYDIHAIKLNKYRTSTMSIIFRKELKKEEISSYVILAKLLMESSKKYPNKREISIELERLYSSFIFANVSLEGNSLCFEVMYDFINPKYCEKGYLDDVLAFPFELLYNPNIVNGEFDLNSYNNVINVFKTMLEEEKEQGASYSMKRSFECMDSNSPSSYSVIGYLEDLDKISPKTLVDSYNKLFTDFNLDIYLAGNIDMDLIVEHIKKYVKLDNSSKNEINMYIDNKTRDKKNEVIEYGDYEQAYLVLLYNMLDLTKRERDVVLPIFNSIFGGNNLTSKLYTKVREKNSLCYVINSYFIKFGSLMIVRAGIDSINKDKSVKLIDECLQEMINGKFSEEDILSAKKARIHQVRMREDSTWSIINIQIASDLDDLLMGNKLIKEYKSVTKKEIVKLAKKLKVNTEYMLCKGDGNERD